MENINLQIKPGSIAPAITVSQYDIGRNIIVSLYSDKAPYIIPEGATVKLHGTKPSELGYTVNGTILENRSSVVFSSTRDMTSEAAIIPSEVLIEKDGLRIGSANVKVVVKKSPHPDYITDGTVEDLIPEITVLVERAEAAVDDAEAAAEVATTAQEMVEKYNYITFDSEEEFELGGFSGYGKLYNDLTIMANRVRTVYALQAIDEVTVYADTPTNSNIKLYDEQGSAIRVDVVSARKTGVTLDTSEAAYIRIAFAKATVEAAIEGGCKIIAKQNRNKFQDGVLLNKVTIDSFHPATETYQIGTLSQIARIGWRPTEPGYPPQQSLASYYLAYQHNVRMMLADVRLTADGQYVCWHDEDLKSGNIKHTDGTNLTAEEKAQKIAELTLDEIDVYDFGIFKGTQYAGLKMLRLKDFLDWCANMNVWAVLENKVKFSSTQIAEVARLIKNSKMAARTIVGGYYTDLDYTAPGDEKKAFEYWNDYLPDFTGLIFSGQTAWNRCLLVARGWTAEGHKSYIGHTKPAEITQEMIDTIRDESIGLFSTGLDETTLSTYYSNGYLEYYDLINSGEVEVNRWIYNKLGEQGA